MELKMFFSKRNKNAEIERLQMALIQLNAENRLLARKYNNLTGAVQCVCEPSQMAIIAKMTAVDDLESCLRLEVAR